MNGLEEGEVEGREGIYPSVMGERGGGERGKEREKGREVPFIPSDSHHN